MARSYKHEIGVGALVVASLGLLAFMSMKVGALQSMGNQLHVDAVLSDAAGLNDGAAVKVAGVDVGRVSHLSVEHDKAVVALLIDPDAGLRTDAVVQVRARSVLGEKYLEIQPNSADAPMLADGGRLEISRGQTEIDQLVNALGPLVGALDPDAVNGALAALSDALEDDPERLRRMLTDTEIILHNAAEASAGAPALMVQLDGTLRDVRAVARDARPVVRKADTLVTRLDTVATDLDPTLVEARGLIADGRSLATEGQAAVADGRRIMATLEGSTDDLERILSNLSEIDKWELRRLLREEGIKVRLRESEVEPTESP